MSNPAAISCQEQQPSIHPRDRTVTERHYSGAIALPTHTQHRVNPRLYPLADVIEPRQDEHALLQNRGGLSDSEHISHLESTTVLNGKIAYKMQNGLTIINNGLTRIHNGLIALVEADFTTGLIREACKTLSLASSRCMREARALQPANNRVSGKQTVNQHEDKNSDKNACTAIKQLAEERAAFADDAQAGKTDKDTEHERVLPKSRIIAAAKGAANRQASLA